MVRPGRSGCISRVPIPASPTWRSSTTVTDSPASDPNRAAAILTIDLAALAANYRLLATTAAPARCAAVVKADAYGLGIDVAAPALEAAGARDFFVAQLEEGIALRALLPEARIAILNGLAPGCEADYAVHRLLPVLNHPGEIEAWHGFARKTGERQHAFLHIDTGMNRLGLGAGELDRLAAHPDLLAGIDIDLVMSHFACADEAANPMTAAQAATFQAARGRLPKAPASIANSSGIFRGAAYALDLVRPGCALYGVNPTPEAANPMRPVVRLEARILQLRDVDSPMTVGYGATFRVARPTKIATIAMGYADGYLRSLSGRGEVWVAGTRAPLVGRVSMDLVTIDVTDVAEADAQPGALVEVIGPHRDVDAIARDAGTIGYEVLTALGQRYARRTVGAAA
ncbi:MAG: alanine racemase [Inquilinus sp.]|nr:alanine racemase [Inquilinus sp.]